MVPWHLDSPERIVALESEGRDEFPGRNCGAQLPGDIPSDRLYRCGCGTDTIHINAWGELGACTMEYEHRLPLHNRPLAEALTELFASIRRRRYETDSPCRTCQVTALCDKKPTDARREYGRRRRRSSTPVQ
ncbi:MAG: hypothetical protein U0361_23575 [Nitrospiraceae bacterium]